MKQFFYTRKSKLLLFMLLAFFAGGVSPTWADKVVLSEGFESNSLATNGWTTSNPGSSSIQTDYKRTGNYGYKFSYTTNGSRYLISPELSIPTTASNVSLSFYYRKATSGTETFKVGYSTTTNSTDAFTWGEEVTATNTSWLEYADNTLPVGTKYIAIEYNPYDQYYLYIDDINLTCTVSGPDMSVLDGTSAISSGYNYAFGLKAAGDTKTFTLKNEGTEACPVSVAHTGSFGAALSATSIPADGEVTLTVTMPSTIGENSDVITISSTADGIDDFVINVSGTVRDESKMWCNFTSGVPTGWTNGGLTVSTTGAGTGTTGGGYVNDVGYGYSLTTPLLTFDGSEKMFFYAARSQSSSSYCGLKVEYSANGTSWTALTVPAVADIAYYYNNSWTPVELSGIPAGDYFIKFTLTYLRITDIYGGTESTAPIIALSQNSYDFGLIDANTTSSAITITNTGKSALTGMAVTSDNANFTVAVADDATSIEANGGTATFTVTMAPNATGYQTATITVKSDNADDLTFTATGAVAKDGTTTAVFNDATYAGWTASGSNLSFNNTETAAYFYYGTTNYLTSPKVNIAADDFLAIDAKMASEYGYVTVQGSANGTSWTDIKKIDNSVLNTSGYTTAIVSGISTDYKYLRLNGYYCYVKQVAGLTYAPVLTVKKGDDVVTSPQAHAFGEIGADQTVTYNFNNTGAGTLNITNVESSNAVFTTNWTETIAASDYNLVITANYDAESAGEQNGAVTVTTTEGTFVINLTSTFLAANAPKFALLIGETEQTTGADLGFGVISSDATKTFIIKNDGTGALNVTSIALPDADYSTDLESAPSTESPLVIAAGGSKTINVTLAASAKAIKTGNIVISATGFDDFSFKADAYVLAGTETIDFNTAIPNTWDNESNGWSIYNNEAAKCTGKKNLTSPKLTFTADDFFIFKVKASDSGSGDYVTVEGSSDNGSTWTAFDKKTYSYSGDFGANTGDYSTIIVSGIPATCNKIRFNGYYVLIDEIAGLTYDANDPKMGIYTNADCTIAATTAETKEFGFATETQTATYYIKNVGTGTMTLALGDQPAGFTQALDKTSVAAGEKATLTITMPAETKGYRNGTVTVNATELGAFTVAVSGIMVDENKLNLDFTTANIPATWTANSWSKNANGYIETTGYSSTSLETANLTAEAGEKIVVVAQQTSSYSSYTFGVNYKKEGDAEWSTLIAAENIGSAWKTLTATIADAGSYQLQFIGAYARIQHIYGLTEPTEPVMVVYDGENVAANTYDFGNVSDAADATHTFTVKNEGKAVLAGLTATLSGEQASHYNVSITGLTDGNLAANATATITVKQLKDNLGAHAATLTISATSEGIADKVITLSGTTRDASKFYADFENGNIPEGWTKNTWSVTTTSGNKVAYAGFTASALISTPMTVAENEALTFKAARQYSGSAPTLKVRYTTDGGVTWSEYEDFASQVTSTSFTTIELTGVPAGTVIYEIYGRYFYLDEISGFAPTTAPLFALATSETLTDGKYDFGQALQAAPAGKVFTITNNGNADLVSDIAANDDVEIALSGTDVTINGSQVTVPAGKTATLTVRLKFNADNPGAKTGSVTIDSNDPVADVVLNFTANVLDATAVNIDFASNSKPEGFYSNGWTYTSGYAANTGATEAELITSKLTVADPSDELSYQVRTYNKSWYDGSLTVQYSTDRKNWTNAATQPSDLNDEFKTFTVSGLKGGDYYLRFAGARVYVDNITGWHFATPAAEHDLYLASATIPNETVVPSTEYTATATVYSLRANETGVYAKLFFGENEVATADAQDITQNGSKTFTLTGNVPATEATYAAKIVVYYSGNSVAWETATTNVEVAHIRTLEITEFTKVSPTEDAVADANNQFDATFTVTLKNTGSTELTAEQISASILLGAANGEVQLTKKADAALAVDGTVQLTLTGKVSAGAGGEVSYYAKENLSGTTYATAQTVTITAQTALFSINTDETIKDFGLVTLNDEAKKTYTITNNGTKDLIVSFAAPEGFSITGCNTVQFANNKKWEDVNVFCWSKDNIPDWPGTPATYYGMNEYDEDVYIFAVPSNAEGIVFNGTGGLTTEITDFNCDVFYPLDTKDSQGHYLVGSFGYSPSILSIAAGQSAEFSVVINSQTPGKKSGTITLTTNAADATSFEIPVKGRVIFDDTWTVDFEDGKIPADWNNSNGWTVYETEGNHVIRLSGWDAKSIMTPRLAAGEGEELTFDVLSLGNGISYAYSNDKITWSDEVTITTTGEHTFTAPAARNYYLRFTGRNAYLDNFVGFALNPLEHDLEIAASSVPTTGTQYADYTATVTLKENVGKAEEITATLYVDGVEKATTTETITANGSTVVTLTWEPDAVISTAVKAYIAVIGTGIDLTTEEVDLTIAAPYELDEAVGDVANATYPALVLKHSFVAGWNTICLPFDINVTDIHAEAKAFSFDAYDEGTKALTFNKVTTTLEAGKPYVIYVPEAISTENPFIFKNVEIGFGYTTPDKSEHTMTFQGTYTPMDAGSLTDCCGLTASGKIAKAKSTTTMKGFRGYFKNVPAGARVMFNGFDDDETTGIRMITIDNTAAEGTYNMQGQKVEQLKKGRLYIINGKKQVVK